MTINLCMRALSSALVAPATVLLQVVIPPRTQVHSPAQIAALQARFDPSLDSLRAGRVVAPASIGADERAELGAARQPSTSLAALRAGFQPSNNEWTWLAIGAAIVLLIVLL